MGMVVPEGVLNTSNLQKIREYFEGKAKIILICSIPQDVFIAAGATVKPSLVFFKRFTEEEELQGLDLPEHGLVDSYAGFGLQAIMSGSGKAIEVPTTPDVDIATAIPTKNYKETDSKLSKVTIITKPERLDALKADLKDKITLLSGHSGVGKSTIINKLVPGVNLRTGDISEYHNKGMHTTTFSEMISLPGGGYLIDTPGIKGFGTIEMADAEISHYFRELFKYSEECRFNNCTHRHEPGCAVIQAVNDGLISESRYKSYLSILDDRMESKYREEF